MSLLNSLKEFFSLPEETYRAPDFSLEDPGPPCKNQDSDRIWQHCECVHWDIERDLWVEAREMAESEEVRELAGSVIEDLDELLEGHEPENVRF